MIWHRFVWRFSVIGDKTLSYTACIHDELCKLSFYHHWNYKYADNVSLSEQILDLWQYVIGRIHARFQPIS